MPAKTIIERIHAARRAIVRRAVKCHAYVSSSDAVLGNFRCHDLPITKTQANELIGHGARIVFAGRVRDYAYLEF